MTARSKKLHPKVSFILFGVSSTFVVGTVLALLNGNLILLQHFSPHMAQMFNLVRIPLDLHVLIVMGGMFIFSFVFLKSNIYLRIFSVCSFIALWDLSVTLSSQVSHWGVFHFMPMLPAQWGLQDFVFRPWQYYDFAHLLAFLVMSFIEIGILATVLYVSLAGIKRQFTKAEITSRLELMYLLLPCLTGLGLATLHRIIQVRTLRMYVAIIELPIVSLFLLTVCIILILSIVYTVKLFQGLTESHVIEKERAALQSQVQRIQDQIQDMDDMYTEVRGMRHDMKSHLTNIQLLAKAASSNASKDINNEANNETSSETSNEAANTELDGYITKLEDTLNAFDFVFQTGNSVSDIIIHQKYIESTHSGIDFSADFIYPSQLNIDAYDMAVILNNALENAIEACHKIADKDRHRYIKLYAYAKGEMFFIELENSFDGNAIALQSTTGLPVSSKTGSGLHGMGIANIKRCAEKYFGGIDIELKQITQAQNCEVFHITIMLQGRKDGYDAIT